MYLRLSSPKAWLQTASDLQMVELQLNGYDAFGKITADICHPDIDSGDAAAFGICFNNHLGHLRINAG